MTLKTNNIHPVFERIIQRKDNEKLLNQHSVVIWLTGLSGSGKSTIAAGLQKKLYDNGFLSQVLDGDNIRAGINNNLKFTIDDRFENIRRIAEISKLFINCGIITINSFISPTNDIRGLAKNIIGNNNLIEVFINAPLNICESRDEKGLYKKARNGEIKNFTGIDSPFDIPGNADLEIKTDKLSIKKLVPPLCTK